MASILVTGSLAYDHIMDFPDLFRNHFLPGNLHNINVSFNVKQHEEHFGGTGGNIAYTLALLGEKPAVVATAGNDFDKYAAHLQASGVDISMIHRSNDLATSFAYILTDQNDNQIAAFYPGAGAVPYNAPLPEARLAIIAPGCLDDMHLFPDVFKAQKTPFFFDPGQVIGALPVEDLRQGIENADVVFANDYEYNLICARTGWSPEEILNHSKTFAVTMGAEGTRLLSRDGGFRVPGLKVDDVLDPTGAGDAYRAGYAKGYIAGLGSDACIKLGSCAASYAIQCVGTQNHKFTMDEFRQRYEKGYSEKCPV